MRFLAFTAILLLMPAAGASAAALQVMNKDEASYFDCVQSVLNNSDTARPILARYLATRKINRDFGGFTVPSGANFLWQSVYDQSIVPNCGPASRYIVKFGCLALPVDDGADAAAMQTTNAGIRPMTFEASAK